MILENSYFRIGIGETNGAIESLLVKKTGCELIGEKRLVSAYRLCASVEGYQTNYIDSVRQKAADVKLEGNTVTVKQRGLLAVMGELDIELEYSIALEEETVVFRSSVTNHSDSVIKEVWFPQIGGITQFDKNRDAKLASAPYHTCCRHNRNLLKDFPGGMGLGSEAAEFSESYPGLVMPWWDIYDEASNTGLYLGYHDPVLRLSTWHTYLYPNTTGVPGHSMLAEEDAFGEPVGLVFSHIRYPFLKKGESFSSGEFVLRVHDGDWHYGSKYYRKWFDEHFPFDKKDSWLRKKSAWFTSIIYQPEDKIVTDYVGYDKWCQDAEKYGVDCHELIGWDVGGLERAYPEYAPEEKLGGREGYRALLQSIHERGAKNLTFVNYNVFDSCTDWYKEELYKYTHQDEYGNTPNWMAWGEGTVLARAQFSVRRHHIASMIPQTEEILEKYLLELVKDGADGFQIDKVCVGSLLDFNPLNTEKPDVALYEGLVQAIGRLWNKCRDINPDFRIASEDGHDRMIPYFDVGYRNACHYGISPLHYVFPEWTACQHVSNMMDFEAINSAVMTGAVICMEPFAYQGSMDHPVYRKLSCYIREVERIREELKDIIFLGEYCDNLYATVTARETLQEDVQSTRKLGGEVMIPGGGSSQAAVAAGKLHYRMHKDWSGEHLAIVVANSDSNELSYTWQADDGYMQDAILYAPFEEPREVKGEDVLRIKGCGLHILVVSRK